MDKVLVCVYVPLIEKEFDVYIPVNKKISFIKKLLVKSISELSNGNYKVNGNVKISNKITNNVYNEEEYIINTDIRNGSKIVIL